MQVKKKSKAIKTIYIQADLCLQRKRPIYSNFVNDHTEQPSTETKSLKRGSREGECVCEREREREREREKFRW